MIATINDCSMAGPSSLRALTVIVAVPVFPALRVSTPSLSETVAVPASLLCALISVSISPRPR
ncbi:MAG: hypothetical protein OXQ29_25015 [Rhodospirillaceae bacterium]|nr:hypothetical protein [Rhodospirillaceae bacterium]